MDINTTGALRSPFSPRVRQSLAGRRPLGLSSVKKNQRYMKAATEQIGDVIYKTPMTTIQTYGAPLPVMVTEALTFASGDVTVRLSPCGWCWVVSGRRVLAWARAQNINEISSPSLAGPLAAKELTLPQTDLAHKADLVTLFYEEGAQMPSCIGVSPEGVVRYWPSVGQEGVYVDVTCELAGQECERLGDHTRIGLLLATTTCTVVLLNPTTIGGRATVTCRTLRPPSGWLGGIGRRVSFLFFGSTPTHTDTKLVGTAVVVGGASACVALVASAPAAGPLLQLWQWDADGDGAQHAAQHAALHEHALRPLLADAYARHLPPHVVGGELNSLEMMALDVRASGSDGLLLLLALLNVARSPDVRYAIAHVCVAEAGAPRVTVLVPVRSAPRDAERDAEEPPRFLPLQHPARALLYSPRYLALVPATVSSDKVEYIDVSAEGDKILGAEMCHGVPLLFSTKHGVLALTSTDSLAPTPSACESPLGSPCPSEVYDGNLSLYEIDPHEVSKITTDACGKLKTAFLFHLRRESAACRAIIEELFPAPPPAPDAACQGAGRRGAPPAPAPAPASAAQEERDVDAVLDRTVMRIATEMLDDVPAGDPRWKGREGGPQTDVPLGSSSALQVAAQLRDKRRAFSLFLEFLRAAGLWPRLSLLSRESGDGAVSTEAALAALAERLVGAQALRRLQEGPDAQLLDAAVHQVVYGDEAEWEEEPAVAAALEAGALSPSDVCYRRVSRAAPALLHALARARPRRAHSQRAAADVHRLAATLHVLTTVLAEMQRCRAAPCDPVPPALGPRALLPALADLVKYALKECGAGGEGDAGALGQARGGAGALADLVLSEAQLLEREPLTAHVYTTMRSELIRCFMQHGEAERAAVLAEKFREFELLIELCVSADDMDRLYSYIDKYLEQGMCEATFSWLAQAGGARRALLVRGPGARRAGRLRAWAARAPARRPLLALLELAQAQHAAAARALAADAAEETASLQRLTTMASLAKLCLAAAEGEEGREGALRRRVEAALALAELQAALPRPLRLRYGLDGDDAPVLRPEELVQMYIECELKELTEYDYKKALDLTDYVQDMERRDELRLRVWCASILHDSWAQCRVDSPADELRSRTFFRLVDLVHVMGGDLELLLPPLEDILTAPELAELVSESRVHFLIKYGYECLESARRDD